MPDEDDDQLPQSSMSSCQVTGLMKSVWGFICCPFKLLWGTIVGWPKWYLKAPERDKLQFWMVVIMALTFLSASLFDFWGASLQQKSSDLETRPYLSLRIANLNWNTTSTDTFIGPDVVYSNLGKIPASNIQTTFYITTDEDGGNHALEEYAKENWGGYPAVTFLAPGQIEAISRRLSLSPSTEVYYFHAVTTYEGIEKDKRYWTELRKAFRITNRLFIEIDSFGNWDRTDGLAVPEVQPPNMADYLPKKPATTQTQ